MSRTRLKRKVLQATERQNDRVCVISKAFGYALLERLYVLEFTDSALQ
jgi:hypothetical protein